MGSMYAEPESFDKLNIGPKRVDKTVTITRKSVLKSVEGNSILEAPETLNDVGFSSKGFRTEFEADIKMGEGQPEFYQTKGSGFGKKRKRKVKKKKRNLIPPSVKDHSP